MMKRQINAKKMFQTLLNVMDDFNSVWSANPALSAAVTSLTNYMDELTMASNIQIANTKGITHNKIKSRALLIEMALQHSAACISYAASIGDTELKGNSKILYSTLNRANDILLTNSCQSLYNLVNPHAASLSDFGADATTLNAFQNAITSYMPIGQLPLNAIIAKKAATLKIKTIINNTKILLKEQLDNLMQQYKTSEPDFYNQYMGLRHPAHSNARRKTVDIKIQVKDTNNNPLQHAEITLTATKGAKRHKLSKQNGTHHFERLKPDTYIITVYLPNYITQTQSISTLAPQTLNVVFVMEGVTGSG